jgi:TorA maturation chaperone TorD
MQEAMFQIRDWYQKYQVEVPNWRVRTDDHLVYQLQFIASLLEREDQQSLKDCARFMDEHLLRWIDDFAIRVASRAITPFYAGLVIVMSDYVNQLSDVLAQILDEPRPSREETEAKMNTRKPVQEESCDSYVPGLAPSW